jgi:hypothetical protein
MFDRAATSSVLSRQPLPASAMPTATQGHATKEDLR